MIFQELHLAALVFLQLVVASPAGRTNGAQPAAASGTPRPPAGADKGANGPNSSVGAGKGASSKGTGGSHSAVATFNDVSLCYLA